jgi:hypothetical protein
MTNYYNPYQQQYYPIQNQPQYQTQQAQPQIQNNGFISVPSEEVARNYPVAPGNSVTFKNENAPYVYTKTMGFSQLDRPSFEKYKLVKEDVEEVPEHSNSIDELRERMGELNCELDELRGELDAIKKNMEQPTTSTRRKKDGND